MAYGASIDKFGIADTNWKLQSYTKDPVSSNATAQDENGDNACETVFDTAYSHTNEYQYCGTGDTSGNIVWPSGLVLGTDTTNAVTKNGVTINTSNTERPRLTVTGDDKFGTSTQTYTLSSHLPTLPAGKVATPMGFIVDTTSVTRTNSSTWAATAQTALVQDSNGQRVCLDLYQGRIEASGELISCTSTATAVADTANGYTLNGPVGSGEENTGYGNSTVNVFKNLLADT
jgi:hypothetical protein